MKYNREYSASYRVEKRLEKDKQHKKLSGGCAGIAKFYALPRIAVRLAAIGALIMLPVATGVAYIVTSLLLPTSRYK